MRVNTASLPPDVPRIFTWRDEVSSTSIIPSLSFGYGRLNVQDCIVIDVGISTRMSTCSNAPREFLSTNPLMFRDQALCPDYNGDNAGIKSIGDTNADWHQLAQEFHNAVIQSSTFDCFFKETRGFTAFRATL
eukprot:TRINITY_DN12599_c1_g4_i2.p2 TRINITY_DN12599_c1_g4~~TRINITY_DN12599_c1_g4_i2.p2  ORF type:complete len:133 (+),score=14.10 TRINITY_DN12599_c1_g4_i2:550-948(+)